MIPNWLPLIPLGILLIWVIDHFWPRTPEQEYDRHLHALHKDMEARGLSLEDQRHEMLFRHAMAELRHESSEAVLKRPSDYEKIIADLAGEKAKELALTSRTTSWRFLKVVKGSPLHHILYEDAMKAVDAHLTKTTRHLPANAKPTHIHIAAVKTHR